MDVFFYLIPGLIAVGAASMAYGLLRRAGQVRAPWSSGLTAEARCLRAYTTQHSDSDGHRSTTWHHVYEFTTADGRATRFEERNGPATTLEGDFVTVYYTAARPQSATAVAPARVRLAVGAVAVLTFLGAIIAFCVFFIATFPG